jgi:hypothetical protein
MRTLFNFAIAVMMTSVFLVLLWAGLQVARW